MGRGIISGVIWGSLVAVMSIWIASQLGDMINVLRAPPENIEAESPKVAKVDTSSTGKPPVVPAVGTAPATDPSRQNPALGENSADAPPALGNNPATTPDAGVSSGILLTPLEGDAPVMTTGDGDSTLPDNGAIALAAPSKDTRPQPVAKLASPPVEVPAMIEQDTPEMSGENSAVAPASEQAPTIRSEPGQPEMPAVVAEPIVDFSKPQVVETPVVVEAVPTPEAEPEVEIVQPAAPDSNSGQNAAPELASPNADADAPVPTGGPVKLPATAIGSKVTSVRTNQLPSIGGRQDEPTEAVADDAEIVTGGPAIESFAVAFENPDARPLMAILLLVDPEGPIGAQGVLPFPVTYVVDASRDNATGLMQNYRSAGFEVVALAPLPARASPADVEVAFQSYLTAVPQAVAVMDGADAAFQSGRQVATQVAEALAASGHGMITYNRGMNSAMQVAERANVPSAVVFREIDKGGQNASAVKRFLDQAAFRAGQQTGVILVGHNRPETITALLEWSLGNRASTVALAPVSAVLLAQ